jgi:hypothetical protein
MSDQEIDFKIDEFGALSAEPKQSLFDSPEFQKWAENQPNAKTIEPEEQATEYRFLGIKRTYLWIGRVV